MNDYDTVSGCTMLHFAARCGSKNVGSSEMATACIQQLLDNGANIYMRDLWSSMMSLHYAAYYNVPAVINLLLSHPAPFGETSMLHSSIGTVHAIILSGVPVLM